MIAIKSMFPQGTKLDAVVLSQLLSDSEVLSTNATLGTILREATRKVLVAQAIARNGGKDFPKGGSHYTTGSGNFQKMNNSIAESIGVPVGLHTHSADAQIEQELGGMRQAVETRMTLSDGSTPRIEFDWTKIDPARLKYHLGNASAPQRYRAMQSGLLTFAAKLREEPPIDDIQYFG